MRTAGLVFVPEIGFRPPGTRVLGGPVDASVNATRLRVVSVAAADDATDVRIEWKRRFDQAACPPVVSALSSRDPMEGSFRAELVSGTAHLPATLMARRGYSLGEFDGTRSTVRATQALRFPPLPADDPVELRLNVAGEEWRVPLDLVPGARTGMPLGAEDVHGGITVRATTAATLGDELLVELEVSSPLPLRQIAAALPTAPTFSGDDPELRRARRAEMRRVLGDRDRPVVLEDEAGVSQQEIWRVIPPDRPSAEAGPPHTYRFAVAFERPHGTRATLVVPFIDVSDIGPAATADLRALPADVELGGHRFRVVASEASGDEQQLVLEIPPSAGERRFLHPARVRGVTQTFSWGEIPGRGFGMTTRVGDPPIVTFQGLAFRVEGPWRLDLSLPQ